MPGSSSSSSSVSPVFSRPSKLSVNCTGINRLAMTLASVKCSSGLVRIRNRTPKVPCHFFSFLRLTVIASCPLIDSSRVTNLCAPLPFEARVTDDRRRLVDHVLHAERLADLLQIHPDHILGAE